MRKTLLILAIAAGSMLAPAFVQTPAEARVFWSIGSVFSVGGFDFAMAFGQPDGYWGDHYGESHYYRTRQPMQYQGYSCHNGCSYRAGYYYHHPDCASVRYHFRRHRFSPDRYVRSAPWYYDGYYNRYRSYDRNRYDRYRYDSHRNNRYRYDPHRYDRGRYDRHRNNEWDSDSDRRDRQRGRGDRSYGRHDGNDGRRDGNYGRDDRRRDDRQDSSRRRGVDSRSRGRGRN